MTRLFLKIAALAIALGVSQSAQASLITYESRFDDGSASTVTAADYKNNWDALALNPATAGYGGPVVVPVWDTSATVSNQGLIAGGSAFNIASKYIVDFCLSPTQAGNFLARFGLDYGRGFAAFLTGPFSGSAVTTADIWWNFDIVGNPSLLILPIPAGHYTLEIYGREGAADGPTIGQFSLDSGATWSSFGAGDAVSCVPEPSSMILLGMGGIGSGFVAWRRRRVGVVA